MKFFVPFTIGVTQSGQIYDSGKKRLEDIGFHVSNRRIKSLSYWLSGELVCHQVGSEAPNGEIITAIFECEVGFFVSTYAANDDFTTPMSTHYSMLIMPDVIEHIDDFDP